LGGLIDESRGQDAPPPSCPRILQTTDVDCEASGAPLVGLRRLGSGRPPSEDRGENPLSGSYDGQLAGEGKRHRARVNATHIVGTTIRDARFAPQLFRISARW